MTLKQRHQDPTKTELVAPLETVKSATASDGKTGAGARVPDAWHLSQEHVRMIVESSDDAIISKTLEGLITSWNPSATRIFGYSTQEAVGEPMPMLFPPDLVEEEPAILKRIVSGDRIDHFETVRLKKDGTRIEVSVSISPIKDDSGQIIGASKIMRDVS